MDLDTSDAAALACHQIPRRFRKEINLEEHAAGEVFAEYTQTTLKSAEIIKTKSEIHTTTGPRLRNHQA